MSINSMTNIAAARRLDIAPLNKVPKTLNEIAAAADVAPVAGATGAESASPAVANQGDTTYNVLFGYIPIEVITLYVAVLAAIHQAGKVTTGDWLVFWLFLVATPVVVWLVYGAKLKGLKIPLPFKPKQWPIWEMVAAMLAYAAWAFALPNSPFTIFPWYSSALAGLAVLVVSTALGLLAPLFQKPQGDANNNPPDAEPAPQGDANP